MKELACFHTAGKRESQDLNTGNPTWKGIHSMASLILHVTLAVSVGLSPLFVKDL